ncbi:MAG: ribosomal protein S19 family protein [Candidatus Micrarchaeota archaeon]|nr:ribosomal protein S19 family protein [Candidatus Micrarchaeota archaeon]
MVERIAFRGKYANEFTGMTVQDYEKLITSRQRRTIKRNATRLKQLLEVIEYNRTHKVTKPIKTHIREAVILPSWIGMKFAVHNGKEFKEIEITANMLGHRLGEFAFTTKRVQHSAPGISATRGSKFLSVK